jgi:hypothetical protein
MNNKEVLDFLIMIRDEGGIYPTSSTPQEEWALIRFCSANGLIQKRNKNTYEVSRDGYRSISEGDYTFIYKDTSTDVKIENNGIIGQANGSSFRNSFTKKNTNETNAYNNAPTTNPLPKSVNKTFEKIKETIIVVIVLSIIAYIANYFGWGEFVKF